MLMKIGILDLQGDVSEHLEMTKKALDVMKLEAEVLRVKTAQETLQCNGIIISGGESTVIGKLMEEEGIDRLIKQNHIPVFGTCAGMVLLGSETDYPQPLLSLIPMKVKRNGFGRQRLSFEEELDILGEKFQGIFIRAPYAWEVDKEVDILCQFRDKVVATAYHGNIATAFHPELTGDTRIHEYFIKEVLKCVE
jgi:5'-phosphate synthase pdxT subunit